MKKNIKLFFVVFCMFFLRVIAGVLDECYKIYPVDSDNLFMSSLNVLSNSRGFEIAEIQTKNGYILFSAGNKYYLLTVTKRYKNQSEIKVLPQNSDFSEGSNIAQAIFVLLDSEIKNTMELVK